MKRIRVRVTDSQKKWMEEEKERLGIGYSELIRRTIDFYADFCKEANQRDTKVKGLGGIIKSAQNRRGA